MQFKCKNSKLSKLQLSSILPIDRTLSDATTLGQSELGSDGNEGVLHILTIKLFSVMSWTLIGGGVYSSAEMQLVYFTAPANWAMKKMVLVLLLM